MAAAGTSVSGTYYDGANGHGVTQDVQYENVDTEPPRAAGPTTEFRYESPVHC